jgi:hypothetical protein
MRFLHNRKGHLRLCKKAFAAYGGDSKKYYLAASAAKGQALHNPNSFSPLKAAECLLHNLIYRRKPFFKNDCFYNSASGKNIFDWIRRIFFTKIYAANKKLFNKKF